MALFILAVWLIIGIVSVPLVIFFMIFLGTNKQFDYSFYRLVQCDLFLNLITYVTTWIQRLCDLEESKPFMIYAAENFYFIYHTSAFCKYFFFNVQSLSSIILCVHRCTTATFQNANWFWARHYFLIYFGIVGASTSIVLPQCLFGYITPVVYDSNKGYFTTIRTDKAPFAWAFFAIQTKVYFACIVACGLATIVLLKKKLGLADQSQRSRQIKMKLALIALINSLIYMSVILWQFNATLLLGALTTEMNTFVLMIASDIMSLSMPYILIFCDKNVKTAIMSKFKNSSNSSSSSIFTQRNNAKL